MVAVIPGNESIQRSTLDLRQRGRSNTETRKDGLKGGNRRIQQGFICQYRARYGACFRFRVQQVLYPKQPRQALWPLVALG